MSDTIYIYLQRSLQNIRIDTRMYIHILESIHWIISVNYMLANIDSLGLFEICQDHVLKWQN